MKKQLFFIIILILLLGSAALVSADALSDFFSKVINTVAPGLTSPKAESVLSSEEKLADCNRNIRGYNEVADEVSTKPNDAYLYEKYHAYKKTVTEKKMKECEKIAKQVKGGKLEKLSKIKVDLKPLHKYWFVPQEHVMRIGDVRMRTNVLDRSTEIITVEVARALVEKGKQVFQTELIPIRRYVRSNIEQRYLKLIQKRLKKRLTHKFFIPTKEIKQQYENRLKHIAARLKQLDKFLPERKQVLIHLFTSALVTKVFQDEERRLMFAANGIIRLDKRMARVSRKLTRELVKNDQLAPHRQDEALALMKQIANLDSAIVNWSNRLKRLKIRVKVTIDSKQKIELHKRVRKLQYAIFKHSLKVKDLKYKLDSIVKVDSINDLIQKLEDARTSFIIQAKNKRCKCYCYPDPHIPKPSRSALRKKAKAKKEKEAKEKSKGKKHAKKKQPKKHK